MKKVIAITFCLCLLISTMILTGCSGKAPEDTEGIAKSAEITPDNLVNPSQETDSSFLYDTSIAELEGTSSTILDEQTVQVTGEVIGDVRACDFDPEHNWITLQEKNDDQSYTMSIYCSSSLVNLIDTFGAYGKLGTTLQVRGTFNLSCKDHDGLSDIHAQAASTITKGNIAKAEISAEGLSGSIAIFIIGIGAYALYRHLYKSRRNQELLKNQNDDDEDE